MADAKLNLIQKLAKIRAISDVVTKDKKGYNYSYADITNILANITAGMKKHGVSLIPSIVPNSTKVEQNVVVNTKFDKTGKSYDSTTTEMLVTADMVFKWVNDDDPDDFIEVPWFVTGSQGDPSQAFGSGLTYCTRYFLCSYFQIAQADSDADAYRSKQKAAEESEDKAIAAGIISQFDTILKQFLADNPDKTDEVKKFIAKFAKNANYLAIKDPSLAAKLLNDFNKTYIKGE
ncbi:MAG: ERF family protein [Clostridia bacterium]|nr:ERF family protein [Clostridia bacterium]